MKTTSGVYGHVKAYLDGKLVIDQKNLITNVGVARIAGLLCGLSSDYARYIALGTGDSPADVGDIALETEVSAGGAGRTEVDAELTTTTIENDTMSVQATFNLTAALELTEMGLFDADEEGTLFSRITFATVSASDGQTLVVTWTYQVTEV